MKKRLLPTVVLIIYCAVLVRVMVFKIVPTINLGQVMLNFGGVNGDNPANFLPFATILPYLRGENGLTIALLNLGGNIVLLVPIGFLVCLVYRTMTWKKALALGALSGLTIEIMQSVLQVGIFDVDDVILNALGVVIGYCGFVALRNWTREKKYIHVLVAIFFIIFGVACCFYIIYPHGEQSVAFPRRDAEHQFENSRHQPEGSVPESGDLCGGTGGTGEIVSHGDNTITIKSKAGATQLITLTDKTTIRTSAGPVSESDLKVGKRVTVVIDDTETASIVLVCK